MTIAINILERELSNYELSVELMQEEEYRYKNYEGIFSHTQTILDIETAIKILTFKENK